MGSISNSRNSEGNFVSRYATWYPFDVPRGKENSRHRYGRQRVMNEAQADTELTDFYVNHPRVVNADIESKTVEVEGIEDADHIKHELGGFNYNETVEIGESLGRLLGDFHRNGISHGDPHLANFLYSEEEILPFDFEFYSSEATLSEMKDDLRLLESDARTLAAETYTNLMDGFQEGYLEELKSDDTLAAKCGSEPSYSKHEEELEEFLTDLVNERTAVNEYYGLTRTLNADGEPGRVQHARNYIRNSF